MNPKYAPKGEIIEDAFNLSSSDAGMLSFDRGSRTSAKDAYELQNKHRPGKTCGTWGVLVEDCANAGLGAHDDPLTAPPDDWDNPAHALVDFRNMPKEEIRKKRKALWAAADALGPLYRP